MVVVACGGVLGGGLARGAVAVVVRGRVHRRRCRGDGGGLATISRLLVVVEEVGCSSSS